MTRTLRNALIAALLTATPATAQTFTASVNSNPNLGNVVASSGPTSIFRFGTDGSVTTLSGNATRASSGLVRGAVQVSCSGTGTVCNGAQSRVRIGSIGSPTGKAGSLSNFTVALASGGTISNVTGTNPVDFTVTHVNKNTPAVIYFGADIPINSSSGAGSVGLATSGYYVYAAPSPTVPTSGVSGALTAVVSREIAFTGTPSLNFGTIVKPASGSGTVTLNPTTNVRTVTGGAGAGSPTPARASYTVTGEGGQTISISVPASFNMARPGGGSITVTLTTSTLPTALSASPGTEGSASFYVGGSFPISAATTTGNYSGSYNVTAQYN